MSKVHPNEHRPHSISFEEVLVLWLLRHGAAWRRHVCMLQGISTCVMAMPNVASCSPLLLCASQQTTACQALGHWLVPRHICARTCPFRKLSMARRCYSMELK